MTTTRTNAADYARSHSFDNTPLVTAAGEIDHEYLRRSAIARAKSQYGAGCTADDITHWEVKLLAMAQMLQAKFDQGVSDDTRCRLAVSALVGQCESIAESGALPEPAEQSLRVLIAQTLSAFNMPSKAERVSEDA